MSSFIISSLSGVVGSAIFTLIIFFGRKGINKLGNNNYMIYRDEIIDLVCLVMNKDYRMSRFFKRLGYLLKYFAIIIILIIPFMFISNSLILRELGSSVDHSGISSIYSLNATIDINIYSVFSFVIWFLLGWSTGAFLAEIGKLSRFLLLSPDTLKKKVKKYVNKFSAKIDAEEKELLNEFINNSEVYFSFYTDMLQVFKDEDKKEDFIVIRKMFDYYIQDETQNIETVWKGNGDSGKSNRPES